MDASAIASWPDHDSIPLGVIVTKIRASSPAPIQLGEPGAQLLCLDDESIERLCAYEAGSLLPHLRALVQMNKAMAAVEQDVLAMWAAGMYEGALHVRLLARCHTSASESSDDHMVHWQHILSCLWIDAHVWSAISRETDSPVACTPFWDTTLNRWTLAELYRRLPSPPPAIGFDSHMLSPPLLRCSLYGYQQNSLAKMLQREAAPLRQGDVYYVEKISPCMLTSQERTYYFDPDKYEFHRASSIPMYSDVRGGLLCDEMGAGKTIVCLALILATLDQMPQPAANPMASAVTSDMARTFPSQEYQGNDPSHADQHRLVTAAFGAPSPGERISRNPHKRARPTPPATACLPSRVPGSITLVQMAAHRLRTTHACREELRETLPVQLQKVLGPSSAPYFFLWPPAPTHVSRLSQGRAAVRVYVSSATLVLVPPSLFVHWQEEMKKHCDEQALRILAISDLREELPRASVLAQEYDLVLLTHARFGKEASDELGIRAGGSASPLMQVYWKRVIMDEGSVLAGESLVVRLCARLRVERRWIVTSTPTPSLVGGSRDQCLERQAPLGWMPWERKNLDALKHLLVRFLGMPALCGLPINAEAHEKLPAKERDWNALMAADPSSPQVEWPAKRRLYDLLTRVMIRNRTEDIQQECPLPPLEQRVVMLTCSEIERLTYNVLQSMLLLNTALFREKDKQSFFHPSNKKTLTLLVEDLALACFHLAGPGLLEQAQQAKDQLSRYLERPGSLAQPYDVQARSACEQLQEALSSDAWRVHMAQGHVMYQLEGAPTDICEVWSASKDTHWTSEELLAFLKAVREYSPKSKNVQDFKEKLLAKGARFAQRKCASSTKLQHMVLEILATVEQEKVLVFSSLDAVLYELANVLELLHVPFLLYVPGMPQHLRNVYASDFSHKPAYRCLLLSAAAGGRGLDLHCASRVILAEPIWQQDLETQVVKLAWRMGQTHRVTVSTYVMRETWEQRLVERKKDTSLTMPGALDTIRALTEDPGMRDLVAHPHLVSPSRAHDKALWAKPICHLVP
ncbi:hypothetical protein MNAN1_001169 [Malassezia nana]|uniref:Helicase C-terminal domain-containing protein n=1 Tax=Malassezia nana TaxID=180528 RepID=A0AAF0EQ72_9BASI|nr:hypothetical protein MNAN1_001169 [Malassezia nana]